MPNDFLLLVTHRPSQNSVDRSTPSISAYYSAAAILKATMLRGNWAS